MNMDINIYFTDTDLHNVIKKGNILKDIHKRYIMYQLCKATHYMHSGNVIHRDQKVDPHITAFHCLIRTALGLSTQQIYKSQFS